MTRTELINSLIKRCRYHSYLEIGVNTPDQPGWSHDSITIELKHGVDPAPEVKATFPVTSDEFFAKHIHRKYDLVFVDGLHIFEQAYRDITNSLQWLSDNGTIVVHDCNPTKEITQRRERASDVWHGDVWKAILKLRTENPDVEIYTVHTDEGCAVIRKGRQKLMSIAKNSTNAYTYKFFNAHRKEILNLISVDDYLKKSNTAVVIKFIGGLGNQMFQYALGRNLAFSAKTPIKYDLSWYDQQTERKFELDKFNVSLAIADRDELQKLKSSLNQGGRLGIFYKLLFNDRPQYIKEKNARFDPRVLKVTAPAYLEGYWQSEKYFQNIAPVLRSELKLRDEPTGLNKNMLLDMKNQEAVSIHVRRGDYVKNAQTNKLYGTPTLEYYQRAANYILRKFRQSVFYVFSDDPAWVEANLKLPARTISVSQNGTDRGYEDLRLMTHCKHHILANSSFSWWGAWLAEHPRQIVIAPKRWYQSPDMDASDLVPDRWLRM